MAASNKLMIPLQCEYYALEGLGQLVDTYSLIKERLNNELDLYGVILTMADFRTNLTNQVIAEVQEFFNSAVFSTVIPRSIKISESPGFGKPAVIYAPNASGSYKYQLLAEELCERLGLTFNYQGADADESINSEKANSCNESVQAVDSIEDIGVVDV